MVKIPDSWLPISEHHLKFIRDNFDGVPTGQLEIHTRITVVPQLSEKFSLTGIRYRSLLPEPIYSFPYHFLHTDNGRNRFVTAVVESVIAFRESRYWVLSELPGEAIPDHICGGCGNLTEDDCRLSGLKIEQESTIVKELRKKESKPGIWNRLKAAFTFTFKR